MALHHKRLVDRKSDHFGKELRCDHCGRWAPVVEAVKATWPNGFMRITTEDVRFEVDDNGDVDRVVDRDDRVIPRTSRGWICKVCQANPAMTIKVPPSDRLLPDREPYPPRNRLSRITFK